MLNLLFALIILATFEADVYMDYRKIEIRKQGILHGKETAVILAIYILLALLFYGFTWLAVCVVALILSIRWLYFDIRLNMRRGFSFYYIGKTSFMDRQLRKLPKPEILQYILKFTLITLFIILICLN